MKPSGSRSKRLQRNSSGDCASMPSGSGVKSLRFAVVTTCAPAFTAAATTCGDRRDERLVAGHPPEKTPPSSLGDAPPCPLPSCRSRRGCAPSLEDLLAPAQLIEVGRGGAEHRVPKREREENVCVDDDDEGSRDRCGESPRLLPLGVVAAELLGHARQLAEPSSSVLVALLFEREDVFDAEAAMLARLPIGDSSLVQQAHEILSRDVQQIGRLLRRDLATDR